MKKLMLFALLLLLSGALALGQTPDPTKHPHYFGPYPNWANSPLTTIDANIQFTDGCGGVGAGAAAVASIDRNGAITGITMTSQGAGYTCAPNVNIATTYGSGASAHATFAAAAGYISSISLVDTGSNYFYPMVTITGDGLGATAEATADPYTGAITGITVTNTGSGYTSASVSISDWGGTGSGALATATIAGAVIGVVVDTAGIGYKTLGGLRKFVDTLPGVPGVTPFGANNLGQYISLAHPDTITYPGSDYYEIAVVEFSKQMHSDLPATKLRGYVQLNNGTDASGQNNILPDPVQYLGATIVATKDRPVRILFKNQLFTGAAGNLFLPVDTTIMGSGPGPAMAMTETDNNNVFDGVRNPMCGMPGAKPMGCYTENRATLHLHGGITPWISDGTPHQWITPAGEATSYPKGVSVSHVPDMWYDASGNSIASCAGLTTCAVAGARNDPGAGAMTFYYTNQQSARLLFYHDHSWGITRLNVYAGEAAGYLITDQTEQALLAPGGPLESVGLGIPLVIQDRTFVPDATQLAAQDPTWDSARWGTMGGLWYHHVYMPAQNPADPTGVSPYGRWMYGPWFWPPATSATTPYQPIPNPYFDPSCDPATNGFCEPPLIPGTPNISVGMEQFNDTPLVNGTVYPTVTLEPKAYRFRILSAANDRFFNLQWYVADASGTEVALNAAEVAAAQNDPNVVPTPDTTLSPKGPSWIQIGSEGGFLPSPVVVPNQPITWITDPTRFDVGNVDLHSLLLAPAERADVIVDFSQFAGKTLILYNDAPAAFPARVATYDYYTGNPDMSDIGGAPTTIPGYGPNTRTVMQVQVAGTPAPAFNLSALVTAFQHRADGSGVFESGQHPIIVGQAGYNQAYGTGFTSSGFCTSPTATIPCDGFARISQQGLDPFTFDTLNGDKLSIPLQPKALHDEMNSSTFDEYGRMTANIGVEAVPATPGAQSVVLYPYVNPATELIDATGLPSTGIKVTPISSAGDGTQIWKITHNGVDTHPIHFHLFDVQVINRVTWDNIIIPPDANELGWKDTVRVSPLEDTIVALRPIIPTLPFQIPNSIRPLNPMMPIDSLMGFNSTDPNGNPAAAPITNELVNFGFEYVWHCHILSHEEMDMMRPVLLAVPPAAPSNLVATVSGNGASRRVGLTWTDRSANATGFTVQRATDAAFTANLVTIPLGKVTTYTDPIGNTRQTFYYRVFASNTVGSTQASGFITSPGGNSFPTMTAQSSFSNTAGNGLTPAVSVSPVSVAFGNVAVGATSAAQTVTVTNTGTANLTISSIGLGGTNPSQFAYTNGCGTTLAPAASCTVSVTFGPATAATYNATLNVNVAAPATSKSVTLSGSGVAPGLSVSPASVAFGNVAAGTISAAHTITVTNTGTSKITITSIGLSGTNPTQFGYTSKCGKNLAASASCTVSVTFAPTAAGTYDATLNVNVTGPALSQSVALSGTGSAGAASAAPSSLTFASQTVATTSAAQVVAITNSGAATLSGITVTFTGTNAADYARVPTTGDCGTSLAAAASCNVAITFTPGAVGASSATLNFNVGAPATGTTVALSGTGASAGATSAAPTSLTFASQTVATTSAAQVVAITNSGAATLSGITVTFTGTNAADYARVPTTGDCGTSLGAGASCNIAVTFTPGAVGARSATLNFNVGAPGTGTTVALSGTGAGVGAASAAPTSLTFASQTVATTSTAQVVAITNSGTDTLSGIAVTLTGSNATDYTRVPTTGDCGTSLAVGASCNVAVTFTAAAVGASSATLNFNVGAPGTGTTVALSGTGASANSTVVSPGSLTFAAQTVGTTSASQILTLTNTGSAALNSLSTAFSGTNATDFSRVYSGTTECRTSLAAGASCTIAVRFTPLAEGVKSAALNINVAAPGTGVTVPLSGTGGVGVAVVSPTSLTFAARAVGTTSASLILTVTNTGTAALTSLATTFSGTNAADFSRVYSGTTECRTSLAAGANCTMAIRYTPHAVGPSSATVDISTAAPSTGTSASLSGSGI